MPAAMTSRKRPAAQIGRRLDVHRRPEHDPRDRDGPQMIGNIRLRRIRHARRRLGAEILDDDFLDVAVAPVQIAQRQQRLDPLAPRLADADENAGRERHRRLARRRDRREPDRRRACPANRSVVRPCAASRSEARLQHDALRHRDRAQAPDVVEVHHAGIEMRQQPGLLEHQRSHRRRDSRAWSHSRAWRAPRAPPGIAAPACRRA